MDWHDPILQPLAAGLNALLALDAEATEQLRSLESRRLAIVIDGLGISLAASVTDGTIALAPWNAESDSADAVIQGPPAALLALAQAPDSGGDQVRFSGDLGVVRDARQFLARLDLDWEGYLARYVGDGIAHQLGRTARRTGEWLQQGHAAAQSALSEFLTEESGWLPTQIEIAHHLNAVDQLREDADRLAARVALLERRIGGEP